MRLSFDSIDEVKEFVKQLKGTRGGKNEAEEGANAGQQTAVHAAPKPLDPPQGGGFPGAGATNGAFAGAAVGAFPTAAVLAPEVQALIARIVPKIDGALTSGQSTEAVLQWFRGQCGPDAANASLDQIKTIFLPKASQPVLENIAKLMNA